MSHSTPYVVSRLLPLLLVLALLLSPLSVSSTPLTNTKAKANNFSTPKPTPYPPFTGPATADASNPSLFHIFRTAHCTGSDTRIHKAQYDYHKDPSGGEEGCYPLSFPWYSIIFEQAAGGQIFTGGGCTRQVKSSVTNGCRSFVGGEVITGVKV